MYATPVRQQVAWLTDRGSSLPADGPSTPWAEVEVAGLALTTVVATGVPQVSEVLGVVGVLVWLVALLVLIALDVSRRVRRHRERDQEQSPGARQGDRP